jgi:hypothetical protein
MPQQVLYVDPQQGKDSWDGRSQSQPLKTLTAALRLNQSDTVIHLKTGQYTAQTGEQFPLVLSSNCQIIGEMKGDRPAVQVQGEGPVQHPVLGVRSATVVVRGDAALKRLTVTNPQGVGVWIEAGRPLLEMVVGQKCRDQGAIVLGKALPTLKDCLFLECGQAGITFLTQCRGHLQRVICMKNVVGIRVQDAAAPFLQACRLEQNKTGLEITDTAGPVLRQTRITQNQSVGVMLTGTATADLGLGADPGQNVVRQNGQLDIKNTTGRSLLSVGNDLVPQCLEGDVRLGVSEVPDPAAVPPLLLDQPVDFADPVLRQQEATQTPETTPAPASQTPTRFKDLGAHWSAPFVEGLAIAGAVAGFQDGTFQPDKSVTRAEFAAFIQASFPNQPEKNPPLSFTDVPRSFWGYEALSKAQRSGFLTGYPDRTMRPNDPITRIQAMVAVTNGLGLTGGRVDDLGIYRDRAQIPSYAVDALATATQRRLVVNYPEALVIRPLEPMTRGEVSALIYQGRVAVGNSTAINSPYIVQPDATQPLFTDVRNHWAAPFIRGLAEANLVSGLQDGRFQPDNPMLRSQFATLLVHAFQPVPKREAIAFKDVPGNYWAATTIQAAYRGTFLSGFPDQTFAPENPMVRVQVWVSLVNGLGWQEADESLQPLGQFKDYTTIPKYALQPTAIALAKQLLTAYPEPTQLRPNQVATRAEVCVSVYQALVALGRLPAIASEAVV